MLDVLEEGLRNRRVAAHEMNDRSSRGHTILTLEVDSAVEDADAAGVAEAADLPSAICFPVPLRMCVCVCVVCVCQHVTVIQPQLCVLLHTLPLSISFSLPVLLLHGVSW